ncbi:MAG: aminoglycoside phosphotransferase family protein [Friedmanniella sp.]|nr:aminoglycoside phosphotransferase family protein [Friedmanniella sp.]
MDRSEIDAALAGRLVAAQFPRWADLPVRPFVHNGWDNSTFRLGDDLTVRLPNGPWYAQGVAKEQRWLPVLAPQLPLPIPTPVAQGAPGCGYPYAWSIYRWLEGEPARREAVRDLNDLAVALAGFLVALAGVDPADGPEPGEHNFFRGGPLSTYDAETREALVALGSAVPQRAASAVWEDALAATWTEAPVWFHGDVAFGNLLVQDGRLAAVIDFGTSGVGDPACDVAIAWTVLRGSSRSAFRSARGVDAATWSRGRGWALWKALITLARDEGHDPGVAVEARRVLVEVLADHAAEVRPTG